MADRERVVEAVGCDEPVGHAGHLGRQRWHQSIRIPRRPRYEFLVRVHQHLPGDIVEDLHRIDEGRFPDDSLEVRPRIRDDPPIRDKRGKDLNRIVDGGRLPIRRCHAQGHRVVTRRRPRMVQRGNSACRGVPESPCECRNPRRVLTPPGPIQREGPRGGPNEADRLVHVNNALARDNHRGRRARVVGVQTRLKDLHDYN